MQLPVKKICGLTRLEDALAAANAGATHLGFIFAPSSPRLVSLERVQTVVDGLFANGQTVCQRVAVTAGLDFPAVEAIASSGLFDIIQLHEIPEDAPRDPAQLKRRLHGLQLWPVLRVQDAAQLARLDSDYPWAEMVLLDTYSPKALGGTGRTFDWNLLSAFPAGSMKFILAGGVNVKRLNELPKYRNQMQGLGGFDVASGVEDEPGIKNHELIRDTLAAMDRAWRALS